ncbi:MAG TPA: nitroreductase/quinone reductase family protein [Acidimicrobiales bacterium]|nr:nitroreductase/quinone reductase family protein [Acidimicrobiales bacterium]
MTTEEEESLMDQAHQEYNAKIIAELRANKGHVGGDWEDIPLLVIHHTGAHSGVERANPVAYLPDGAGYFIWAANGGVPRSPDWYFNLKARPETRIEVGNEIIDVLAEEATGTERARLFANATDRYPQLLEAAQRTERVIPLIVLHPARSR